jgi:hypothetical protein
LERTKTSRARTVPTSAQASEVVIEIEVVLDRGVDGGEFKASAGPDLRHGAIIGTADASARPGY